MLRDPHASPFDPILCQLLIHPAISIERYYHSWHFHQVGDRSHSLNTTNGFNLSLSAIAERQTVHESAFIVAGCADTDRPFTSMGDSGLSWHIHPQRCFIHVAN